MGIENLKTIEEQQSTIENGLKKKKVVKFENGNEKSRRPRVRNLDSEIGGGARGVGFCQIRAYGKIDAIASCETRNLGVKIPTMAWQLDASGLDIFFSFILCLWDNFFLIYSFNIIDINQI